MHLCRFGFWQTNRTSQRPSQLLTAGDKQDIQLGCKCFGQKKRSSSCHIYFWKRHNTEHQIWLCLFWQKRTERTWSFREPFWADKSWVYLESGFEEEKPRARWESIYPPPPRSHVTVALTNNLEQTWTHHKNFRNAYLSTKHKHSFEKYQPRLTTTQNGVQPLPSFHLPSFPPPPLYPPLYPPLPLPPPRSFLGRSL